MDITTNRKDLLKLLGRMQSIASRKSTMPILSSVLLTAEDSGLLRGAATDLFLSVAGSITATVKEAGAIAVSARDLFDRVKAMPEGSVIMQTSDKDSMVTLKSSSKARRYTLHYLPGSEFPQLPTADDASKSFALPTNVVERLIARTSYAISTDETRAHVCCALLEVEPKQVRMVTTDGHRLSKAEELTGCKNPKAAMLIPLKAVQELRRVCEEAVSDSEDGAPAIVHVRYNASSVFFDTSGLSFGSKLVDATFPPYAQVIPQSSSRTVKVSRSALVESLKAISLAADDKMGGVKLAVSESKMRLTAESSAGGHSEDELTIVLEGAPMVTGFNAGYLVDALSSVACSDVELLLGGELDPAVIRVVGDDSFLAVVMPIRI